MTNISLAEISDLDPEIIEFTFGIVDRKSDEFATSFYQILFNKYPNLRSLFLETDMQQQKDKLSQSLTLIVVNIRNPSIISPILRDLGERHVRYGANLTDYPLIGDALLQSLQQYLGEHWNYEVEIAWSLAYKWIAATMEEGAKIAMEKDSKLLENKPKTLIKSANKPESKSTNRLVLNKVFLILIFVGILVIVGTVAWKMVWKPNPVLNPLQVEASTS